jgi:hypothetical protein
MPINYLLYFFIFFIKYIICNFNFKNVYKQIKNINKKNGDWGLGIGDWGLGIGDWAKFSIPNT